MEMYSFTFKEVFAAKEPAEDAQEEALRRWITLGHTDELCYHPISTASINKIQSRNRINTEANSNFHHTVFFLPDQNKCDEKNDFFIYDSGAYFLAVTRLHFCHLTARDSNGADEYEEYSKWLCEKKRESAYADIHYRTYYTTELSDMILISRCRKFSSLAKWAMDVIHDGKYIGHSYTYYCIPLEMLNTAYPDDSDRIDSLSIRFDTFDPKADKQLYNRVAALIPDGTPEIYNIAGNEDYCVFLREAPVAGIIELYSYLYASRKCRVITRIGVKTEKNHIAAPKPNEKWRECANKISAELSEFLKKKKNFENREWFYPLIELTHTVVNMAKAYETDELALQILPPVYAFLKNINAEQDSCDDDRLYLEFVENCTHSLEHLLRSEWQLSQRPDLRPAIYNFPIISLEYVTAFLASLSDVLLNEEPNYYFFLLYPKATDTVSTANVFFATDTLPGLLLIEIPFMLLYKPSELLAEVSHELSHNVGVKCRHRAERLDYYLRYAAHEYKEYLMNIKKDPNGAFLTFLEEDMRRFIENAIEKEGKSTEDIPLFVLEEYVAEYVDCYCNNQEFAFKLREFIKKGNTSLRIVSMTEGVKKDKYKLFKNKLHDITTVFREAYADLAAAEMLKVLYGGESYIDKYFEIERIHHYFEEVAQKHLRQSEMVALRFFTVLFVFEPQYMKTDKLNELKGRLLGPTHDMNRSDTGSVGESFFKYGEYLSNIIAHRDAKDKYSNPEYTLYQYINLCKEKNSVRFNDIQDVFCKSIEMLGDTFLDVRKSILEGREKTIEKIISYE